VATTRPTTTRQRDRDRARVARLLKPHAPPDWEQRFRKTDLLDRVIDGEPIQMFVMAADIRESTTLMKEAVRFERFALVMDKFVTSVRRGIRSSGGWFDSSRAMGSSRIGSSSRLRPTSTRSDSCKRPGTWRIPRTA
jgi:class 3 adenylate cyclase